MFDRYYKNIQKLNGFEKEDILNEKFKIDECDNMKIYYAPHNEIINKKAKIFIVGITPGWTQTQIAYKTAYDCLKNKKTKNEILISCKKNARFAGSMRKNLIEMMDQLNINHMLNITSCSSLFEKDNDILHTTSVIPYPVFINGKNYTGTNPKIIETDFLYKYVKNFFIKELEEMNNCLIIPLGKSVEEILNIMVKENLIKEEQCLFGFPHPSGANGHRTKQFDFNKNNLKIIVNNFYI